MTGLDESYRDALRAVLARALDDNNAADLETITREVLHNGAFWDLIAEAFPMASASVVRSLMLEAFAARQDRTR